MARRRKTKGTTKCPEPINTLIDLAAAATFDYIAYKRRKKHGGKPTRIDPYEAAGIAYGLGHLDSTEDIIRLGGKLGAMGAFNDEESEVDPYKVAGTAFDAGAAEDIFEFGSIPSMTDASTHSANTAEMIEATYGISAADYTTRDDFIKAINTARFSECVVTGSEHKENLVADGAVLCKVSCLDNGQIIECISNDISAKPGTTVRIAFANGEQKDGIILTVTNAPENEADCKLARLPRIMNGDTRRSFSGF